MHCSMPSSLIPNSSPHLPNCLLRCSPKFLRTNNSPRPSSLRIRHNLPVEQRNKLPHPFDKFSLYHLFRFSNEIAGIRKQGVPGSDGRGDIHFYRLVNTTEMRFADLKAAVGQRINIQGIISTASVLVGRKELVLPHLTVPDIRYIEWGELKRKGFKGVVFDKDNTITAPYSLTLWPPLGSSMKLCKEEFGDDVVVFSNSVGLLEYDHNGLKAGALERSIGINVLRHSVKKPAGTAEEIEKHFGCDSSELIMVGDRPFTDIVFGNRNGFLTILTKPLTCAEEPFIVGQVRKLEMALLNHWLSRGLKPISHCLLPDAAVCVKDPPTPYEEPFTS